MGDHQKCKFQFWGKITTGIYGCPGAGKWLHELGVIFSDYLNRQKARIKTDVGFRKDEKAKGIEEGV